MLIQNLLTCKILCPIMSVRAAFNVAHAEFCHILIKNIFSVAFRVHPGVHYTFGCFLPCGNVFRRVRVAYSKSLHLKMNFYVLLLTEYLLRQSMASGLNYKKQDVASGNILFNNLQVCFKKFIHSFIYVFVTAYCFNSYTCKFFFQPFF